MTTMTTSIKCGNCKGQHETVAAVRACYGQPVVTAPVAAQAAPAPKPAKPATEKQVAFIQRLSAERGVTTTLVPGTTTAVASAIIDSLLALPKADKPAPAPAPQATAQALEMGMYHNADDDRYFRVYPAKNGGHLLAKELVRQDDDTWAFEYLGAAKRFVQPAWRMTLEDAKAFGHQFGVCCMCGALLTDPESVAAGIGPVCAGKV